MNDELALILYAALAEPIGLLLQAPEPELARQALYKARREAADPALAKLQIRLSPLPGGELVITRGISKQVGASKAQAEELDL